ncbi:MAG TPA: divergent polysaccharide deacetylase family protein [Thermoanaerobaculia bacterium]
MSDPPRRISPATAFFALLALALGIALYIKTRPPEPQPEKPRPVPHAARRPRPLPALPPPAPTKAPELYPPVAQAQIAIVIDDLGNDREAVERIARWPFRVAGAVLPGLPGSAESARRLAASGKEVLLHLPMEPDGYPRIRPGPGVVLRSDSDEKIAQTVADDLDSVPGAVGVNNHMGSAATADPRVMRAVVRVLAARRLFLLDSRTTEATVARRIANEESLPAVSRQVFLDAVESEEAIERSFRDLLRKAKKDGTALAIGHPHAATLALLERELPSLRSEGVELVTVSALASQSPKSKVQNPKSARLER